MKLALLAPDPHEAEFTRIAARPFAEYARALATVGITLRQHPWREPPPGDVSGGLALTAWGYHLDHAEFLEAVLRWKGRGLLNPTALIAWNSDKRYLIELERARVPIVPTQFAEIADEAALAKARARFGPGPLVVKPRISGDAHNTAIWRDGGAAPGLPHAMIQPMLSSIAQEGERSLIFFGGRFSHMIRKVPAPGDFRVQEEKGGRLRREEPSEEALELAQAALATPSQPPVYARVDIVRLPDGRLGVIELELIEPDLYLHYAPDREAAFANAVAEHFLS